MGRGLAASWGAVLPVTPQGWGLAPTEQSVQLRGVGGGGPDLRARCKASEGLGGLSPPHCPLSFHSYDICIYKNKPCGTLGRNGSWVLALVVPGQPRFMTQMTPLFPPRPGPCGRHV